MKEKTLIYKGLEVEYTITTNEIPNQNQRYFHASMTTQSLKEERKFLELLKMFREIVFKAGGKINILWDDLSTYYSSKAYPLVHQTENLLRKLISKFMLVSIGMNW